jgi:hypothetical protein
MRTMSKRAGPRASKMWMVCLLSAGLVGCEPYDPPEEDMTPASCCGGAGTCVPSDFMPDELASQLDGEACGSEALVCAPNSLLFEPDAMPVSCRAPGDLEGRCLSTCLPSVAAQADRLDQRGCDRDERCVPCFDPLTGADTEACRVSGDAPAEKARTYQSCCGAPGEALGTCVPLELLSSTQIDALPVESCREPGTRCVPSSLLDGSQGPEACDARDLLGASSQGACMAQCFLPLTARFLSTQASCAGGERCIACTALDGSVPACE